MSKTFQVSFMDNDKRKMTFRLTGAMKKHLAALEAEDTSDLDFTLDGTNSVKLSELLDLQDESAEFEAIVSYLNFLADPLGVEGTINENLVFSSPIHENAVFVLYGKVIFVGQPKPAQNMARWVRFDVKRFRGTTPSQSLNIESTLWVKQEYGARFNFNDWVGKMVRIIGTVHDKWVIKVYQVITQDRSAFNAGGSRI